MDDITVIVSWVDQEDMPPPAPTAAEASPEAAADAGTGVVQN